jgi:flagellin-specific chaperone FliS
MRANKIIEMYEQSESDVEFSKKNVQMMFDRIMKKIDVKAPAMQAEMLNSMMSKLFKQMMDMPQGERKIYDVLKDYRSEM